MPDQQHFFATAHVIDDWCGEMSFLERYVNVNLPLALRDPNPPCPEGRTIEWWKRYMDSERERHVVRLRKEYEKRLYNGWRPEELLDPAAVYTISQGDPRGMPNGCNLRKLGLVKE